MVSELDVSVVCAVGPYAARLDEVHRRFAEVLAAAGRRCEFLYVLDGPRPAAQRALEQLDDSHHLVRVFHMARGFGEAAALQFGIERARAATILTIADRLQIDPRTALEVLARLEAGDEVVVTRREPRRDGAWNRLQNRAFHALVRRLCRQDFRDLTCGLRGFRREPALRLELYGDQHRFIPVIAAQCGYHVTELAGPQLVENAGLRVERPGAYARRLLDVLNIYFLTRFTRKPLRFFGLIGLGLMTLGCAISLWLAAEKFLGATPLAGRPLLLLGVLLIVLGVQLTSIGLVGEIVIFLSSRRATPEVREIVVRDTQESGAEAAAELLATRGEPSSGALLHGPQNAPRN